MTTYLSSLLAFSAVSALVIVAILPLQVHLNDPRGRKGMTPALAFITAISFMADTGWQNDAGESTLDHVGLAAGLGVAVALIREMILAQVSELGNSWVDVTPDAPKLRSGLCRFARHSRHCNLVLGTRQRAGCDPRVKDASKFRPQPSRVR